MFKKHTTLFLFPTNLKFKNHAIFSAGSREKNMFAKHEPGSNKHPWSCKHLANAHVKPMKNIENTMKFPPTKRLRMDIHDLNICYPSANSFRLTANPPGNPTCCFFSCAVFLHCSEIQVQFGVLIQFLIRTPPSVVCVHANYPTFWMT